MASPSIPEALNILRARASASSATLKALKEQAIAQQKHLALSGHKPSGEALLTPGRGMWAMPRTGTMIPDERAAWHAGRRRPPTACCSCTLRPRVR